MGYFIVLSWSASFLDSADFSNFPKGSGAHFCWSHSAVSRCCTESTIWNHSGNHFHYYPACNYWKHCSVLWSWAFRERDELLECHKVPSKKSYTVFVRAAVLPRGYVAIYWRQSRQKKTISVYSSRGGRVFSQLSMVRVELVGRTGHPVIFRMVQGRLVAVGYYSKVVSVIAHSAPSSELHLAKLSLLQETKTPIQCRYSVVRYNTICHTALRGLKQNVNQGAI